MPSFRPKPDLSVTGKRTYDVNITGKRTPQSSSEPRRLREIGHENKTYVCRNKPGGMCIFYPGDDKIITKSGVPAIYCNNSIVAVFRRRKNEDLCPFYQTFKD